jgi:hypothetical protein
MATKRSSGKGSRTSQRAVWLGGIAVAAAVVVGAVMLTAKKAGASTTPSPALPAPSPAPAPAPQSTVAPNSGGDVVGPSSSGGGGSGGGGDLVGPSSGSGN